jgi:hypothetical protein
VKPHRPTPRHDRHDTLLIVRFYGGDVTGREAETARALVADCAECAALLTDLGAIADATRLLPAPPRPRDFTLTEADAARLGGARRSNRRSGWTGVRRSMGGILTAAGLLGVLFAGVGGIVGPASNREPDSRFSASTSGPAYAMPSTAGGQELVAVGATPVAAATAGPTFTPQATRADNAVPTAAPSMAALATGATANPATGGGEPTPGDKHAPTAEPGNVSGGSQTAGGSSGDSSGGQAGLEDGSGSSPPDQGPDMGGQGKTASSSGSSAADYGWLVGPGFALVLLLGLGLLAGPALLRGAGRRLDR